MDTSLIAASQLLLQFWSLTEEKLQDLFGSYQSSDMDVSL